jgi:hypothetical protein
MTIQTYAAIPTVYAGVQFRSRLEARWAAFFDLLGWKWEYEPFDLEGYIPDFLLHQRPHTIWLAEVKPVSETWCEEGFEKLWNCKCGMVLEGTAHLGRNSECATFFGESVGNNVCGHEGLWKTAGNKVQYKGVQAHG